MPPIPHIEIIEQLEKELNVAGPVSQERLQKQLQELRTNLPTLRADHPDFEGLQKRVNVILERSEKHLQAVADARADILALRAQVNPVPVRPPEFTRPSAGPTRLDPGPRRPVLGGVLLGTGAFIGGTLGLSALWQFLSHPIETSKSVGKILLAGAVTAGIAVGGYFGLRNVPWGGVGSTISGWLAAIGINISPEQRKKQQEQEKKEQEQKKEQENKSKQAVEALNKEIGDLQFTDPRLTPANAEEAPNILALSRTVQVGGTPLRIERVAGGYYAFNINGRRFRATAVVEIQIPEVRIPFTSTIITPASVSRATMNLGEVAMRAQRISAGSRNFLRVTSDLRRHSGGGDAGAVTALQVAGEQQLFIDEAALGMALQQISKNPANTQEVDIECFARRGPVDFLAPDLTIPGQTPPELRRSTRRVTFTVV